jgi:hypothetical protein
MRGCSGKLNLCKTKLCILAKLTLGDSNMSIARAIITYYNGKEVCSIVVKAISLMVGDVVGREGLMGERGDSVITVSVLLSEDKHWMMDL